VSFFIRILLTAVTSSYREPAAVPTLGLADDYALPERDGSENGCKRSEIETAVQLRPHRSLTGRVAPARRLFPSRYDFHRADGTEVACDDMRAGCASMGGDSLPADYSYLKEALTPDSCSKLLGRSGTLQAVGSRRPG
jgi:hypothetical protein